MFLVVLLGFVPVLLLEGGAAGLGAGLAEYGLRWESSSLVYRFIEPLFGWLEPDESWSDPRRLGRILVALVWGVLALGEWRRGRDPILAAGSLIGAFLILSPTLHPWYLCWIVPFLALGSPLAWAWLVAMAPLLYWPLGAWRGGGEWVEPAWLWPVMALPFGFLLAVRTWREGR